MGIGKGVVKHATAKKSKAQKTFCAASFFFPSFLVTFSAKVDQHKK
jgi:hypothetical protein